VLHNRIAVGAGLVATGAAAVGGYQWTSSPIAKHVLPARVVGSTGAVGSANIESGGLVPVDTKPTTDEKIRRALGISAAVPGAGLLGLTTLVLGTMPRPYGVGLAQAAVFTGGTAAMSGYMIGLSARSISS
jgi:hypothetical protein